MPVLSMLCPILRRSCIFRIDIKKKERCGRGGLQLLSRLVVSDSATSWTAGFLGLHCLLASAQAHVHWVDDGIQPPHPLLPPSPPALNMSLHQGLLQEKGGWGKRKRWKGIKREGRGERRREMNRLFQVLITETRTASLQFGPLSGNIQLL